MKMSKEVKQESSIPVQSRVSFMSLAKLHMYWIGEGYVIRTMSQLVGWSVDLLCEVLEANEKMPGEIDSLAKAHQYLQVHGLYQGSSKKIAMKKIGTALRFEALREHGIDPKSHIPLQHKMLHRETSVEPLDCIVGAGTGMSDEEWEEIQRRIREEEVKEMKEATGNAIKAAKAAGLVVNDPKTEEPEKLCLEEARAKYFKVLIEVKREHPELSEEEAKNMAQAEIKDETLVPESGPVVKEGMNDEEYEEMIKDREKRDLERRKLENAPFEASDLDIVSEPNEGGK
jgi:hypothetical protein